jgi:formate dehydrogenase major subunit
MTNHWGDLANADRIMIIGSNAAENHPISFKWVLRAIHGDARQRKVGEAKARLISVDPRLTRTGSRADLWVPIRPGTDIALIGGMIRYALEKGRIQKEYVIQHTNAGFKLSGEYTGAVDGIFTGFDPEKKKYNKASWSWLYKETWQNALGRKLFKSWVRPATVTTEGGPGAGVWTASWTDEAGAPAAPANPAAGWVFVGRSVDKDPELGPGTVFEALKKHFSRYTPEKVSEITGTPMDKLLRCYEMYTDTHKP